MSEPRVLIATPIAQTKLYCWPEWVESIARQDFRGSYDVLLVDNTDEHDEAYLGWLHDWVRSEPFGAEHRVRLKRFGQDVDGRSFLAPLLKVGYSERLIWNLLRGEEDPDAEDWDELEPFPTTLDYAARWTSYTHLLSLECDVLMPPHAMRALYLAGKPWAAAWMLSRDIYDDRFKAGHSKLPLLWHSLDLQHYASVEQDAEAAGMTKWDWLASLGYYEPPTTEPFPCVVTHLGCTLIDCEVIRSVPFRFASTGGDVTYSWDVQKAGIQPYGIPYVRCEHVAAKERPDFVAPWAERQEALA